MSDTDSKVIVVTGATSGLGLATAVGLSEAGHRIVLHGRSEDRIAAAMKVVNPQIAPVTADLGDLNQVDALADTLLALDMPIDVLINNAGLGMTVDGTPQRHLSADGHEMHWAVNYLATVRLTERVLPAIASNGRIINVVSKGQASIDFEDLTMSREYEGRLAYQRSKLAQTIYTFELAERLAELEMAVTVNALHPATRMPTGMAARDGIGAESALDDGVKSLTRLATSPDVANVTGQYFNVQNVGRAHDDAYDTNVRTKLAEATQQAIGPYRCSYPTRKVNS